MAGPEPSIQWLIVDMKRMRINGATNAELSRRATEIHDRLAKDRALAGKDSVKGKIVEVEAREFKRVLEDIRDGRGKDALSEYDNWAVSRGGKKSGGGRKKDWPFTVK